jgi:hypothetical protein
MELPGEMGAQILPVGFYMLPRDYLNNYLSSAQNPVFVFKRKGVQLIPRIKKVFYEKTMAGNILPSSPIE